VARPDGGKTDLGKATFAVFGTRGEAEQFAEDRATRKGRSVIIFEGGPAYLVSHGDRRPAVAPADG
jgi:hypothetical protein